VQKKRTKDENNCCGQKRAGYYWTIGRQSGRPKPAPTNTMKAMTSSQIINLFPEVDVIATQLCDLSDSEFETGGRITDVVQAAGYDESGRECINDQGGWNMTIYEWAHAMSAV
jgi:hypothetical protein